MAEDAADLVQQRRHAHAVFGLSGKQQVDDEKHVQAHAGFEETHGAVPAAGGNHQAREGMAAELGEHTAHNLGRHVLPERLSAEGAAAVRHVVRLHAGLVAHLHHRVFHKHPQQLEGILGVERFVAGVREQHAGDERHSGKVAKADKGSERGREFLVLGNHLIGGAVGVDFTAHGVELPDGFVHALFFPGEHFALHAEDFVCIDFANHHVQGARHQREHFEVVAVAGYEVGEHCGRAGS